MSAWDAEVGSANWGPRDAGAPSSAVGSGYPETKDEGAGVADTIESAVAPNWQGAVPSEQANTQGPPSEPSAVVINPARAGLGAAKGAPSSRRHTMAFEIARVERAGKSTPPNPQKAKHVWDLSRPRYVERTDQVGRRVRVLPGQEHRDAVPYGVWGTSWAQMGDFGLDVGMYFVTMAQLMGAVLVYAALCIVAMVHFSSEQYSGAQANVRADLQGSAVCTSLRDVYVFVEVADFAQRVVRGRHDCPLDAKQGYADMAGVLLLFLLLFVLGKAQDKAAEYTDTQVHSARAYTVKVSSPDPLADDPDRWRRLFAQFGHVSYVTVARGNGSLLRAMAGRRKAGRVLEGSTANINEVMDAYKAVDARKRPESGPGGWWKAALQPLGLFRDTNYWKQQLWSAHDRVEGEVLQGMHDQGLPVVKVFITFESDMSQGRCLSHMSRGILDAPEEQHMYTNPDGFKEPLKVMPASPAAEVVYEYLHVTRAQRTLAQCLTLALTAAIVVLGYLVASKLEAVGVVAVAVVITALDAALPSLVRLICSLERHHNVVAHELSVMSKLTLARWANLAGIPFFLNEHLGTLTATNLELVATVLWFNVFIPPAIRLLDVRGRWARNVLARKEVVQSAMDSHFRGSTFYLSERYTDTSKTMFACLVYTPVFPLAMWLCLASLTLGYWVDKYLFMRCWKTPHPPGNSGRVAKLARRQLALAVLAHCVFALYYYAGWPFDHVCRFQQGWIDCMQEGTGVVEAETQSWMPGAQKTLVNVFSALNVAWLVILLLFYYLQAILRGIAVVVKGAPRKLRSRQHMPFSQLTSRYQHEVDAYVPQICHDEQPLPLLACDLDLLEPETIPWKVDGHKGDSFEDHCLSSARDLPRISRYQRARLFSLCVHYPPPAPFEGMGNGRTSKTDIDWFRRPPPGLQETKIPEVGTMAEDRGEDVAMQGVQGHELVIPAVVERIPQSHAHLQSNGEISAVPSSFVSREGEQEQMMPGGAQSSLTPDRGVQASLASTAILRVSSAEVGEGSAGTNKNPLVIKEGVAALEAEEEEETGEGEGGEAAGRGVRGGPSPMASSRSLSMHSTMSGRSGRSGRLRMPRVEQGDETSDICAGEGADEYANRRRSLSRQSPARPEAGNEHAADADALAGRAAAATVAGGGRGGGDAPSELDGQVLAGEDGEYSYYDESHITGEVVEDMHDLPTPVRAPLGGVGRTNGNGELGSGAGLDGSEGGGGRAGSAAYQTQRSDCSDGWVDQYTNSSLGGSREDLAGVAQAPSVSSLQVDQWRKARMTPAV